MEKRYDFKKIKLDRLSETNDWFAQDSVNMSTVHGREKSEEYVESFMRFINEQRNQKNKQNFTKSHKLRRFLTMASIRMEFTYPRELEKAKAERWPVLIPIGTMEYHSSICPYGCDSLVAMGLIDKVAEKVDCVVMPPVWYGVASYAVAGPEKGSIHVDCDTFEQNIYCILKSLFLAGFNRNIYLVICHQTEDFNPMELACRKAARKLVFEYLDQTKGYGWWGKNENKEFYQQMSAEDNPWNWVQVMGSGRNLVPNATAKWGGGDHAGKCECSMLEYLWPGTIKLDRLPETDDWFAQDSVNMSHEFGMERCEEYVENFVKFIKAQKGIE